jgi:DNA-binding MarR family transcriptional regulator
MEEVLKILQQWVEFAKAHPDSEFEDFCRYYLKKPEISVFRASRAKGPVPADIDGQFMMTVSRTTLAFWVYMRIALKETPMPSIESLMICSALNNLGESRKSDVINYAMLEISTGTDIVNRLIKKGFILQRTDISDKRSRLLTLSDQGRAALFQSYQKAGIAREILLAGLTEDDKKLVAHILNPVQEKHSRFSVENKGRTIEEIRDLI